MSLGYAGVKEPLREPALKARESGAVGHCGGQRRDAAVCTGQQLQLTSEYAGEGLPAFFQHARDRVVRPHSVVLVRMQLSHRIAAALLRYDVQQHGHAHVLCPPQRALQRRGVVPVDGSKIVKAQVVKDVIVKYGVLDVLFYGVYGVVYRLYPAYSVPVTPFELKICRAHTHAAQQSGHTADIAAYAHGVVVQDDHQRLARLTRV